jgi:hypothetical protein
VGLTGNVANNFSFYVLKLNKIDTNPLTSNPQPIEDVGSQAIFYDSTGSLPRIQFSVSAPSMTEIQVDISASEKLQRAFAVIAAYSTAAQSAQGTVERNIDATSRREASVPRSSTGGATSVSLTIGNLLSTTRRLGLIIQVYIRWLDVE